MDDAQIIEIFFRRDPAAIDAVQQRYGKRCLAAACHILPDSRDAEECVSDVWLRLWNAIPPERPRSLAAYIATVTRRVALDKCAYNKAAQRRSDLTLAFDELEGCLSGPDEAQAAVERELDIHSSRSVVEQPDKRTLVADTDTGAELKRQIAELERLLRAYRTGEIAEGAN